jgi:hypothetical protein
MTGRYLIYTPLGATPRGCRNGQRSQKNWHTFVEVCRSLHRDGLSYQVQFNLAGETPHVLIVASGTAKLRAHSGPRPLPLPPPVPAQHCRDRALEVEWFLPENMGRRNNHTSHWGRRQARYRELSQMAEEHLRAELEYWRELELLSGQRDHFKPGRTDETLHADDEVAA